MKGNIVGQRNTINGKNMLWITRPYMPGMWTMIKNEAPDPKIVVELGTNVGRWAKEMLTRFPTIERLYALDLWFNDEQFEGWKGTIAGDPRAIPLKGWTNDKALYEKVIEPVDILYVDASHKYEDAFGDLVWWSVKVRQGGLILADDYCERGVQKAVANFLKHYGRSGKGNCGRFGGDLRDRNKQFWILKDWE